MNLDGVSLLWLITAVILLSFAGVLLMRGNDRFWLPNIITWLFVFFIGLTGVVLNSNELSFHQQMRELRAEESGEKSAGATFEIERVQKRKQQFSQKFMHTFGAQTLFTLFWVLVGYKVTGLLYYKKAAITFSLLSFCYLLWLFL
jgi:hypothetical protein